MKTGQDLADSGQQIVAMRLLKKFSKRILRMLNFAIFTGVGLAFAAIPEVSKFLGSGPYTEPSTLTAFGVFLYVIALLAKRNASRRRDAISNLAVAVGKESAVLRP